MVTDNATRRSFLRKLSVGAGLLGAGVAAACGGKSSNEKAQEYLEYQKSHQPANTSPSAAMAGMDHGNVVVQASGAAQIDVAAMDKHHEDGVKYYLANTKDMNEFVKEMPYRQDGDTKVFEIEMKAIKWEFRPGEVKDVYSYNGVLPGPTIRVNEGDKVRIIAKNNLPESTAIHWHGLYTPNTMDGVPFVTQPQIKPGQSFTYEFTANPSGSHMYHSHHNAMEQVGRGLLGAFIVDPQNKTKYGQWDKEYTMVLNDTLLGFTLNGKSFPATGICTAKKGQKVLVRFMNEGLMNHPMHLHGGSMKVVAKDGYATPNPWECDVLDVAPGDHYDVIIDAQNPGAWAFHCHTLSHAESPEGMFGLVTVLKIDV